MSEWHKRKPVEPVESVGSLGDKKYRHDAYGQITLHEARGARVLYDSDFEPGSYMVITIHRSSLNRGLNSDRHYAENELIEVHMTHAQWVAFVSSQGKGSGVPCTIEHIHQVPMPLLPRRTEAEAIKVDMKETLEDSVKALNKLREVISGNTKISKGAQNEFLSHVDKALREIQSNVPFVTEMFAEHVEKTSEKAKAEVHGYLQSAINRAGLKALGAHVEPVKYIEDKSDEN